MEQCESPDSTVPNDTDDYSTISPENCRYENVGGAPKLIIKNAGSTPFVQGSSSSSAHESSSGTSQLVPPSKIILKRGPPQLIPKPGLQMLIKPPKMPSTVPDNDAASSSTSPSPSPSTPTRLPNRFLTGNRNFLKTAPRKSLPALQPISSSSTPSGSSGMSIHPIKNMKNLPSSSSSSSLRPLPSSSMQITEIKSPSVTFSSIASNMGSGGGIKLQIRRDHRDPPVPPQDFSEVDSTSTQEPQQTVPPFSIQRVSSASGASSVDSSTIVVPTRMKIDVSNVVTNMMKPAVTKSLSIRPLKFPTAGHVRPYKKKIPIPQLRGVGQAVAAHIPKVIVRPPVPPPPQPTPIQKQEVNLQEKEEEKQEEEKEEEMEEGKEEDSSTRRTGRKRKPTKHYMTDMFVPSTRRRKEVDVEEGVEHPEEEGGDPSQEIVTTSSEVAQVQFTPRGRGRPRGTTPRSTPGRGRGRPRGSTMKAKMERLALQTLAKKGEDDEGEKEEGDSPSPTKSLKSEGDLTDLTDSSPVEEKEPKLPLEGDKELNEILKNKDDPMTTPKRRGRGSRGPRGSRGSGTGGDSTPRSSLRGSRRGGTPRSRGSRGRKLLKAKRMQKKKPPPPELIETPKGVQVFEEETRMDGDISFKEPPFEKGVVNLFPMIKTPGGSRPQSAPDTPLGINLDDESRASNVSSTSTSNATVPKSIKRHNPRDFGDEFIKPVTAETLFEYQWPQEDRDAEYYFLQEQITEFVGQKSFRRKYPNLRRRVVEMEERDFIRECKAATETQCDLGLTAVNSSEVLDILFNDFPEKYEAYRKVVEERREKELTKATPTTQNQPVARDRSAEFMRRILKSCAQWNASFNQQRKEDRSFSFDLQTGTLNVPRERWKVVSKEQSKVGHYPVAVLPGQFCDSYKSYTPTELKYLPLNTVMYGPVVENENADEDDSATSDSSSDDSSSDDDSSSSSSEDEGQDQNGVDTMISDKNDTLGICKTCNGDYMKNKDGRQEILIHCAKCDSANHPTCLELTLDMVKFIKKYNWQCTDCKNCIECNDPADEDKMLFCDCCDRGYHIYCVGLRKVPTGRWHCIACSVCHSCGVNEPSGDDRAADWHHEFQKGEKGAKYFLHSLCVSCHKIFKKGQFCPACLKCHLKLDDKNLLECRNCEKWVHKHCVKRQLETKFGFMCDQCNTSFKARTIPPSKR